MGNSKLLMRDLDCSAWAWDLPTNQLGPTRLRSSSPDTIFHCPLPDLGDPVDHLDPDAQPWKQPKTASDCQKIRMSCGN